ncbi:hypothetical protein [Asaia sp. VD9]|uniref:hypothetical protein n=1 Tax=Asaia sp. VD9 TaxID=3081235 RepID=UPI003018939F
MTTALLSLPLWMQFLAGFVLLGLGLMFILMPFSIFGVKPRLEEVELQLNEVRAELRIIAMRLGQSIPETGPSGEPVYAPPRRSSAPIENRTAEPARVPEIMPWSTEANRQAPQRPVQPRDDGARGDAPPREAFPQRDMAAEDRRDRAPERPVDRAQERQTPPPEARDDYSYAESGAQENIERILRPTHFDPPPPREAPRPPRPPVGQEARSPNQAVPDGDEAWRLKATRPEAARSDMSRPDASRSETSRPDTSRPDYSRHDGYRVEGQRQEMAPRSAAAEAERLRQAEEAGARRVRSEPTLRWPPRP